MTQSSLDWSKKSKFAGPQHSPGFTLWHGFMCWQRGLNAELRPYDVTQPQFAILAVCGWMTRNGGKISQQSIADFLDMDRMHISQIASRLEQKGLICRDTAPENRRVKLISLTPNGNSILEQALPIVESFDNDFFEKQPRPTPQEQ